MAAVSDSPKKVLHSSDDYLFLLLAAGSTDVIRLHDQLYTGMLARFHKEDRPFVPHVTLGVFEDADRCARVLMDAERMELEYESYVDRVHLVKINDDRSQIVQSEELRLRA